jgi:hypothetical protein
VLRAATRDLRSRIPDYREVNEAVRRAYPFHRRDLMDEDWQARFEDEDWDRDPTPEDWCRRHRMFLHKLMRLAYAEGTTYIVDELERDREQSAAQLSYVLADAERKRAERETAKSQRR